MYETYQTFLLGLLYMLFFSLVTAFVAGIVYAIYLFPYVGVPAGLIVVTYFAGIKVKKELEG